MNEQELITKKDTLELFNIVLSTIWHWQKKAGSLTTHNIKIKDLSMECVDMGLIIRQSLNLIEEVMARYFK